MVTEKPENRLKSASCGNGIRQPISLGFLKTFLAKKPMLRYNVVAKRQNISRTECDRPARMEEEHMRGVHSAVDDIRRSVFTEVARLAYEGGDLNRVDLIPYQMIRGEVAKHRADVFLERAVVRERVRLALGLNLLGITKIKVANLLPAMVFSPLVLALYNWAAAAISALV